MSLSDRTCPRCGASGASVGANTSGRMNTQVAYVKELSTSKRPKAALVLTTLGVIGAVTSFLLAGSMNFIPSISALNSVTSTFSSVSSYMPYFLAVVGVIALLAAFGFWKGARWAWKAGLVFGVLEVVSIISPNVLGLLVGIASIGLLMTSSVKNWLRK